METKPVNVARVSNNWYLLTGLLIGLAVGLLVSLLLVPLTNAEALPAELDPAAKAEYRLMIARAYVAQPNNQRAESRLALLRDPDPAGALVTQAQELLAAGGAEEDARALAHLSAMLSIGALSAP
ncbi:MAG: hypothetical protein GXY37_01885 [Chloroflexi bacterium]|nr:hypothetical protein [Chloroflexota bacterium]